MKKSFALSLILAFGFSQNAHGIFRWCHVYLASLQPHEKIVSRVIETALKQREALEKLPLGKAWVGYLENVSKGNRGVPNIGEVTAAFDFMLEETQKMRQELAENELPNPKGVREIQEELLPELERRIQEMKKGSTVQRAELLNLAHIFAKAATQQIFVRENGPDNISTFQQPASELLKDTFAYTEEQLDSRYGVTALPLATRSHFGFRGFLQLEATGIIPLGITVKREEVDGFKMHPYDFLDHDVRHANNRLTSINRGMPASWLMSRRAAVDMALAVAMEKNFVFSQSLDKQIQTLPSRRKQLLAEGIIFHMIHEETKNLGILDFDAGHIRDGASDLLTMQGWKPGEVPSLYQVVERRLQSDDDLGQAFKSKPTREEITEILKWLKKVK